jgi:hypothetical protein
MTPLIGGYTNSTFLLEGTKLLLVAKITRKVNSDSINEIGCLGILNGSGIAPSVYETFEIGDLRIIIMDYREGINGQSILDEHKWDNAIELYRLLGMCLASRIHSITYLPEKKDTKKFLWFP